uniref:Transmembrane protein n=1 Tax=Medicago truncatula TaxID=3880 RepID=I3S4S3_MEDTR|nr:unknown [Medicago truncatula]
METSISSRAMQSLSIFLLLFLELLTIGIQLMFSGESKLTQYWTGITLIYDMEQVFYRSSRNSSVFFNELCIKYCIRTRTWSSTESRSSC